MDLSAYLAERRARVDETLAAYLPPVEADPAILHEAMHYSVFGGGKRIRAILALAAAEAVNGRWREYLSVVSAIELIHVYSLVHDDLPLMDNDDVRRGRPTTHKVYGEAVAVLVGDAHLTAAFTMMADHQDQATVAPSVRLRVIAELGRAVGSQGMVGGQCVDIQSQGLTLDVEQVRSIHAHKTGALIRASVRTGALLAGATEAQLTDLTRYGEGVGLAFQIADDLLDVDGSEKGAPSAGPSQAVTYPVVAGVAASRRLAWQLVEDGIAALARFDERADPLREIARYVVERKT